MTIKIILLALFCVLINIPLGAWRKKYKRFSVPWFVLIHASVPIIIALRLWLGISNYFIPLFIALAVAGQFIGNRIIKTNKAI